MLLAARQPWACGLACRWAVAFASLAQAVRDGSGSNRPRALSEDQQKLVQVPCVGRCRNTETAFAFAFAAGRAGRVATGCRDARQPPISSSPVPTVGGSSGLEPGRTRSGGRKDCQATSFAAALCNGPVPRAGQGELLLVTCVPGLGFAGMAWARHSLKAGRAAAC